MQRNIFQDQQGSIIIEMGLFIIGFSFMVIALIDFGSIISAAIQLGNAVRIGEQVALAQYTNTSGITQAVQNATSLPSSGVTASATTFCECSGASATCGTTCAGTMATYETITGSYSVPLLLNYPGLSNPYPLTKSVSARVQ